MAAGMKRLRDNPPTTLGGEKVVKIEDFQTETETCIDPATGAKSTTVLPYPPTNMLAFTMNDGSKITVRPSGTEPKVKIYCEVVIKKFMEISGGVQEANLKAEALIAATQSHMQ